MHANSIASPYWSLSSFYFVYCAILGVVFPYWGPYLEARGISPLQVGLVSSVFLGSNIIAANFWGWIGDRISNRIVLIRAGNIVPFFCFAYVPFVDDFNHLLLLIFLGSFFWQGLMPQFEVVALEHTKSSPGSYGRARMWGSIGFIFASTLLGHFIDDKGHGVVPIAVTALFLIVWLNTMFVPGVDSKSPDSQNRQGGLTVLVTASIIGLLLSNFFLHLSHGVYYSFFSLYLDKFGFSSTVKSALWSISVAAEVLMFFYLKSIFKSFDIKWFFLVCLALTVVRWLIIGSLAGSLLLLFVAQILHAFSFAGAHVCTLEYVRQFFGSDFHGRGQAIYSSICVAGGSAVGALLGGYIWALNVNYLFYFAAFAAALSLAAASIFLPRSEAE